MCLSYQVDMYTPGQWKLAASGEGGGGDEKASIYATRIVLSLRFGQPCSAVELSPQATIWIYVNNALTWPSVIWHKPRRTYARR